MNSKFLMQISDAFDARHLPTDLRVLTPILRKYGIKSFKTTRLFLTLCQKLAKMDYITYEKWDNMLNSGSSEKEKAFCREAEVIMKSILAARFKFGHEGGEIVDFLTAYASDLFHEHEVDFIKNTIYRRKCSMPSFLMPIDKACLEAGTLAPHKGKLSPAGYSECAGFFFIPPTTNGAKYEFKVAPFEKTIKFYKAGGQIKYTGDRLIASPYAKGASPEAVYAANELRNSIVNLTDFAPNVEPSTELIKLIVRITANWIEKEADSLTIFETFCANKSK